MGTRALRGRRWGSWVALTLAVAFCPACGSSGGDDAPKEKEREPAPGVTTAPLPTASTPMPGSPSSATGAPGAAPSATGATGAAPSDGPPTGRRRRVLEGQHAD